MRALTCLAVLLGLSFGVLAQEAPDLARARSLIQERNAAEAYALLAPHEDRMAGNVQYDYLLGVAALESGRADRATLAFERVLAVNPNFAGARLDLARAYFHLGDLERSRTELDRLSAQRPPPAAQQTIARYREAIEQAEKAKRRRLIAWAELTIGHDTNVNNSTSLSVINVPALGNLAFTLNPTNVKTADEFGGASLGAEYAEQLAPGFGVFAGLDWRYRAHADQDLFDFENRDLRAGLTFGPSTNQLRLSAQGGEHLLDRKPNRTVNSLGADWRYQLDALTQLSAFASYARFRFSDPALVVNSFNARTYGVGALRVLGAGRAALFGALFAGEEVDTNRRADGAKDFQGARLGGQIMARPSLDLFAMASYQEGDYERRNAAFLVHRSDRTTDLTLGLAWRFAKGWTLRPVITRVRNQSNIPLFSFERTETTLTLRRDFVF
jgi:outer membrane protein